MKLMRTWWARLHLQLHAQLQAERDRGDVPGWVMVTVMSAILVVALLAVFEQPLKDAVTSALNKVTNSN